MDEIDFVGIEEQDEDIFTQVLRRNHEVSPQEETLQLHIPEEPSDEEEQDMVEPVM